MPTIPAHPTISNRIYIVVRFFERRGFIGGVSECCAKLARFIRKKTTTIQTTTTNDFSEQPGTDHRPTDDLRIATGNLRWTLPYQPSSENIFRRALQCVTVRHSDYLFIDIGAGKGLILLRAAEYPFKSVIGIEFSESLARVALENVRTYNNERQCRDIQCICGDATEFTLPSEPSVLYLFNPFQGKLMDRMIEKIKLSLRESPRDLWIIYVNPWEDRKFRRSSEFKLVQSDANFSMYRAVG